MSKHTIAEEVENLDCVLRCDTGKQRIIVVFDSEEASVDQFRDEIKSEYYEAVKEIMDDTLFAEEGETGPDYIEYHSMQDEFHLNFVL